MPDRGPFEPPKPTNDVRERYEVLRRVHIGATAFALSAIVVLLVSTALGYPYVAGGAVMTGWVTLAVVRLFVWKCPSCRAILGKTYNPRFCPGCGVQFHD